jgi:hypothetical protein
METDITTLDCVAFANTLDEFKLAEKYLPGATAVRITLSANDELQQKASQSQLPLWVDSSCDGFHHIVLGTKSFADYRSEQQKDRKEKPQRIPWMDLFLDWQSVHRLGDPAFIANPDQAATKQIVSELMKRCNDFQPNWLSVPQLPLTDNSSRNRINAALAKAAGDWSKNKAVGDLILPAIFTHKRQTVGKTQWRKKVEQIIKCARLAHARRIWIVDTSLDDVAARPSDKERLLELVEMHKFLAAELTKNGGIEIIAGPYWGFNLSLWSRGLVQNPAMALGTSSSYVIPGMPLRQGKIRIVLNCLRRKVDAEQGLLQWLGEAKALVDPSGLAFREFSGLVKEWKKQSLKDVARGRIIGHYSKWIGELQRQPPKGRALALFQTLTAAYALGSQLPDLPKSEQPARRPGQVAEHLMLTCLS